MSEQELEWHRARCPVCGQEYSYVISYKPLTCGNFSCVHKFIHPELHGKEVIGANKKD